MRSLEGPLAPVEGVKDATCCDRVGDCTVRMVWGKMGKFLVDYLTSLTLADLVVRQQKKDRICAPVAAALAMANRGQPG